MINSIGSDPAAGGEGAPAADGMTTNVPVVDADAAIEKLHLSDEQLLQAYQQMLNIRHFEEQCERGFRAGKSGGYVHLYIGQEAVSTGILDCTKPGDQTLSTYRDHAHCLALGSDPGKVMAEIQGKATGVSRGKGRLHAPIRQRAWVRGRLWDRRRAMFPSPPASAGR